MYYPLAQNHCQSLPPCQRKTRELFDVASHPGIKQLDEGCRVNIKGQIDDIQNNTIADFRQYEWQQENHQHSIHSPYSLYIYNSLGFTHKLPLFTKLKPKPCSSSNTDLGCHPIYSSWILGGLDYCDTTEGGLIYQVIRV